LNLPIGNQLSQAILLFDIFKPLYGDYLKALLIASDNQCHWGTFICAREVIRNGISEGNLELAQKAFSKLQAALVVATR